MARFIELNEDRESHFGCANYRSPVWRRQPTIGDLVRSPPRFQTKLDEGCRRLIKPRPENSRPTFLAILAAPTPQSDRCQGRGREGSVKNEPTTPPWRVTLRALRSSVAIELLFRSAPPVCGSKQSWHGNWGKGIFGLFPCPHCFDVRATGHRRLRRALEMENREAQPAPSAPGSTRPTANGTTNRSRMLYKPVASDYSRRHEF